MHFELYQDAAGGWRWRLLARNGRIVADGGEAYASESNARRALGAIMNVASVLAVADIRLNARVRRGAMKDVPRNAPALSMGSALRELGRLDA